MAGGSDVRLGPNTFAQHIVWRIGGQSDLGIHAESGEAVLPKLL